MTLISWGIAVFEYVLHIASAYTVAAATTTYVRRHFLIFEAELAACSAQGFLCGPAPSVLDSHLWMLCFWMDAAWIAANCPSLSAQWERLRTLPALAPIETAHFG